MIINPGYEVTPLTDVFRKFDPTLPAVAIDFETFYDDECSVSNMSYYGYTHHPKFNAFMVAIHCRDFSYVGPVEGFDWNRLRDYPLWLAHNSPFDRAVFKRCVELGQIPEGINPLTWINTIDVCAFKKVPRSLAKAMQALYGIKRSKKVRTDMKGKVYEDIPESQRDEWLQYAAYDGEDCYRIWEDYKLEMPMMEHLASIHTSETVERGVYINREAAETMLDALRIAVNQAENQIPWSGEQELTATGRKSFFADGRPKLAKPTSTLHMNRYLTSQGIPKPEKTDVKSPEFQAWEREWGHKTDVIKAIHTWRKCNMLVQKFEHILNYTRPDGRMEFQLKYAGGHTFRWSGTNSSKELDAEDEKGINMQNLLKQKFYLDKDHHITIKEEEAETIIDLRSVFCAPEKMKFTIADASQIEPRCLGWVTDDQAFLDLCSQGFSPYTIHAVQTMGYSDDPASMKIHAPKIYALAKARVLALGYGAGWLKFIQMAALYIDHETFMEIFHADVDEDDIEAFKKYCKKYAKETYASWDSLTKEKINIYVNSWLIVTDFRNNNKRITKLWKSLDSDLRASARRREDFEMELPSGRCLTYSRIDRKTLEANTSVGSPRKNYYGGKLCENLIQAIARDVFTNTIINLELAGYPVIWHVHDEVICETAPDIDTEKFHDIFVKAPEWMPDLPIATEIELVDHYKK